MENEPAGGDAEATPKKTSEKQIAANRRNAMKSTGPRTAEGQEVSRMNAVKHGILSKVLVRGMNLEESEEELEELHRRFWEELQPVGPLEEMLVDQIVTAQWRLRRALTAESGEIALSVDREQRSRSRGPDPALQWMKWTALGDPIHAMEESSLGNVTLRDWLGEVRKTVEAEGALSAEVVQILAGRFGDKPNGLVEEVEAFRLKQEADGGGEEVVARERKRSEALAFLDRKIAGFQFALERCAEEEDYEAEARQAAAVLPSKAVLKKILRYEAKLERQIYRAMAQLERLQRRRGGEAISPPLCVQVSGGGL